MKILSRVLKTVNSQQKGQVLLIVLILLLLGALIIPPTISHAGSSLIFHRVTEWKAEQLYAADSGVEYALITLSNGETTVEDYNLNNTSVNVTIEEKGDGYLITSTATSDNGSSTTIDAGVSASGGFAFLFDNVITSPGDVTIKGVVSGNVTYGDDLTIIAGGSLNGTPTQDPDLEDYWPSEDTLSSFYLSQVVGLTPYPDSIIDLADTSSIGSLYRQGSLSIDSTAINRTATLDGTVYVTGDLIFAQAGVAAYTIDLNEQTIFCEGAITVSEACTIIGSGCIIAIGDVIFKPQGDVGSEDDFVFIMSISGTTKLQPTGTFYGSIAGDALVYLEPNSSLTWTSVGGEGILNFPEGAGVLGGSVENMTLGGWDIS